jgi:hypothetical protein
MLLHQGAVAMQKKFASYLILSLAFSTFLAASLAARQTPQTWVTYTPPSGKFTAQFPAEPKPDHQTSKDGGLTTEVYTYMWADKGVVLVASYMDLDANATPSADADLKAVQDNLVQGAGGKVLKSTPTQFPRGANEMLPTLQFTGETDRSDISGAVIYDVYHIYMLLTLCPKDQQCADTTLKFLTSFKLNPVRAANKLIPAPSSTPAAPASHAAQQTDDTWVKFTSPEGKFSALFPSMPKPDHKTTHIQDQTIETTNFIVVDKRIVIGASYTDYDPKATYPVEDGMKAERDALLKGLTGGDAKLLTNTRSEFPRGATEKLPSLVFTAATSEQTVKAMVVVDDHRVYIVMVLYPKTVDASADMAKFFSSFKLTP